MRGAALLTILTSNAYVLDLELDGTYAPLRFAINDDLQRIARAWRQKHPSMTGGDCEEGDGRCVEDVLVRAMESRFDARHVISNAAIHCKLPGHAFPSEKLRDAVGTPDESYALEQAAGFCYCAADRNFVNNRTGGISAASVAMDAAGLALRLEPRRARAARFGMLAGQDLFGVADATAYFARRFAELKWPPDGSLPSLVLGGSLDLSVTLEPRVAWSPSVEESRSHVRICVEIIFCRAASWPCGTSRCATLLPPRHRSDAVASMAWNLDAVDQTPEPCIPRRSRWAGSILLSQNSSPTN
jgi:hypothetical protein